ncbi:hypothetical protein RV12_GL002788 [Enterococcus quebecensis]|nr:hypothetical protein RV12_GL002788 [Enterococcus quebecensis]
MFIPTTTFLFFILLLLSNTPFPSAFSAGGFFIFQNDLYYYSFGIYLLFVF